MEKILTLRSNNKIVSLLAEIQTILGSVNRTKIVNDAIEYSFKSPADWKKVHDYKFNVINPEYNVPNLMQFKVDDGKFNDLTKQIIDTFTLNRLTIPYAVQLILVNYLMGLKGENDNLVEEIEITDTDALKEVIDIFYNRNEIKIKKIKAILKGES